jgi:hypothetical protein
MQIPYNSRERELIKAANQFKKRAENLVKAGKLSEEHLKVISACDQLTEQIRVHASKRSLIEQQHDQLKKLVQDHAQCPRCKTSVQLKLAGVFTNEQGWKMNKYRCRRCNIEFVWNRPNNPWHMLEFIDQMLRQLDQTLEAEGMESALREQNLLMKEQIMQNLQKLKPVVEDADENLRDIRQKDEEMARMLHEFKNYLLIETIRLDTWENKNAT